MVAVEGPGEHDTVLLMLPRLLLQESLVGRPEISGAAAWLSVVAV